MKNNIVPSEPYKPKPVYNKDHKIVSYQLRVPQKFSDGTRGEIFNKNWKVPKQWETMSADERRNAVNNANMEFACECNMGIFVNKQTRLKRTAEEMAYDNNKITFSCAVNEFVKYRKNNAGLRANTTSQDIHNLSLAIKLFGDKELEYINLDDGNTFISALYSLENDGVEKYIKRTKQTVIKHFKRGTIIKYFTVTHAFFRWCKDTKHYMAINPLEGKRNKLKYEYGEDVIQRKSHTIEEMKTILNELKNEPIYWQLFTLLFIDTGCRRGEVLGVEWSDISFKNESITIKQNVQRSRERGTTVGPIKNNQVRNVYPSKEFFELLKKYQKSLKENINEDNQFTNYVFYDHTKARMMRPNEVSDYYKMFGKKIGLKLNPHKFRHTLGNLMADNGTTIKVIAETLGDSIEVANRYYTNDAENRKKEASKNYQKMLSE